MTGRRLLEEPPPERPREGALATAERCASDDPWLPVRSIPPDPPDPPEANVVVVLPDAVVDVVVALLDFDFVLTTVLVVALAVAGVLVLAVVGVTDGVAGAFVVVVVGAGAGDPWFGGTSVDALQICA
jgi:hypothetical protein